MVGVESPQAGVLATEAGGIRLRVEGESGGSSAETVQLWATFSGQLGSRRSVRPRNCCVADAVATAVRSIRVFTAGQSHPSPKRPRVPTTTSSEPSASSRETAPTTPDPVVPRTSRTATSSGQGSPVTGTPSSRASAGSSVSA